MDDDFDYFEGEDDSTNMDEETQGFEEGDDHMTLEDTMGVMKRSVSFQVIAEQKIMSTAEQLIQEVMTVCALPSRAAATILLRFFKWDKEKLIERYSENPEKTLKEATGTTSFKLEELPSNANSVFQCLICFDDVSAQNSFAMACKHRYCTSCWKEYLENKIHEGPACILSRCPYPKCPAIVHEEVFKRLISKQEYDRYVRYMQRSFVDDSPTTKWCPAPGCGNCIHSDRASRRRPVMCSCGFQWCFRCNDFEVGDHTPASCEDAEKWAIKASDESENVKWMQANTKKCSKCRAPIEKNGGCMHMTCGTCKWEFCWMCRGPWSEHGSATGGYYECNKYDASQAKKEDEKTRDIKTELETYMWYFHRYESHKNAGKIAKDQRSKCEEREVELLQLFDVRSQDTKFLGEATEQLIRCRRVLQWSYVMGYYLQLDKNKSSERNLFEYLQEDLEKHTNHLSELYERTTEKIGTYQNFMKWKEDITNYTRVTQKFLGNFLEGVAEGLMTNS